MPVWRNGNGVGHIYKVKLHRARLVLGLVTTHPWRVYRPTMYPWPLDVAVAPWVGAILKLKVNMNLYSI